MLKKIDEKELTRRIQAEQALYKDRKSGIDHYAEVDPASGRPVTKYIDGGVETFPVPSAFEVLPVYFEAVALGNTLHPLGLVQVGLDFHGNPQFELYTHRPVQVQKLALDKIAADVTTQYTQEIESHNAAFIESEVQAQLDIEERRVARELAEAAAKRRAEIEAEVRAVYQPAETAEAPAPTKGRK
ncbi:hypothetical protein [Pseudomonas simiae]|jgi:hypothetical protein|uniref:Uncharacterized protein n=1 Tax=Pseudomonas simiae TaxID=321846 RepID=U1SXA4_9PSED|nr:hypothetical protein [Pseudomonas simiae]ERH56505.1 hypothetical protein O204_04600 [Pseudomonas simiae]